MKTRLAVVMLLGVAFAPARGTGGDPKADLKRFEGTWVVESALKGGKAQEEIVKTARLTFAGDKFVIKHGDGDTVEQTFKIDASKKPRQIDFVKMSKTYPGIYVFEGGKLKLCVSEGGDRPTEFTSTEGSMTTLLVLKRAKK
jgi:uncharacterized protein (TIGR03067 family)